MPYAELLVFIIGFFTGLLDALIGAGGLISIPLLILSGMPANQAIAVDRFGCLGAGIASTYKFYKSKQIVRRFILPLSLIALCGAFIGASLLVKTPEDLLEKSIGILLILLLPVVFIKKDFGLKQNKPHLFLLVAGYILFFFLEIYAGFINISVGIFSLIILSSCFGLDFLKANATMKPVSLLASIVSILVFASNGLIDYVAGMLMFAGMFSGAYLGAVLALKGGSKFIRIVLILVVIFSAFKLFF